MYANHSTAKHAPTTFGSTGPTRAAAAATAADTASGVRSFARIAVPPNAHPARMAVAMIRGKQALARAVARAACCSMRSWSAGGTPASVHPGSGSPASCRDGSPSAPHRQPSTLEKCWVPGDWSSTPRCVGFKRQPQVKQKWTSSPWAPGHRGWTLWSDPPLFLTGMAQIGQDAYSGGSDVSESREVRVPSLSPRGAVTRAACHPANRALNVASPASPLNGVYGARSSGINGKLQSGWKHLNGGWVHWSENRSGRQAWQSPWWQCSWTCGRRLFPAAAPQRWHTDNASSFITESLILPSSFFDGLRCHILRIRGP
eukprot:m.23318 g.23318  ORF g.23318 m.23318 type:complete len:315 (+) comp5928_c0_seq1:723-1667(+)